MAANVEWDIPFTLTSPEGTLILNQATGDRYLLVPQACDMGADVRAETDNVPQGDGSILHHRFETGYKCSLTLQLWYNEAPACYDDAVRMLDTLNLHVRALLNAGDNEGRLSWVPTGASARMLDDIRLAERLVATLDQNGVIVCTFAVDTAYPYAMDLTQTPTPISDGGSSVLANDGTTDFYPVIQAIGTGPQEFYIGTTTLGSVLHWTTAYPGTPSLPTGEYIEFDFFKNTAYLNGNSSNMMAGVDFGVSEFFPLEPGNNLVTVIGCDLLILWQSAWD